MILQRGLMAHKGIILAGGPARLHPLTLVTSKQLLPTYDRPMIYYPLATLMLGGVTEILTITTPRDQEQFKALLGDGGQFGLTLSYATQPHPRGLADAFIVGRDFVGGDDVCLILGDNIFYGHGLPEKLHAARAKPRGATIFGYVTSDPQRSRCRRARRRRPRDLDRGEAHAAAVQPRRDRSLFSTTTACSTSRPASSPPRNRDRR
jgi:glucose-1-phosphate thymidylyltransferase short form